MNSKKPITKKSYSYRVDEKTKENFDRICDKYGITTSSAISIYINYVTRHQEIPALLLSKDNEGGIAK